MIELTEIAAKKILEIAETDQLFEIKCAKIVIDQMSVMYLMGIEVDYVDGLMGAGFKFNGGQISGKVRV